MKIIKLLAIALQIGVYSCSQTGGNGKISDDYVKMLAKGDFKIPSSRSFDILFVRSDNKRIVMTSVNTLYSIYRLEFKQDFKSYAAFLSATLNGNLEIPKLFFGSSQAESFVPETRVVKIYEQSTRDEFVRKYCDEDIAGAFTLKDSVLHSRDVYTVLYCLFLRSFQIQPVDSEKSFAIRPIQ